MSLSFTREVTVEPYAGGRVHIDVDDSGTGVLISGQFLAIEHSHLLRFTWSNSNWADPSAVSIVEVTFEPAGDGETLMSIEHTLLPASEFERFNSGWILTIE